MTEFPRLTLVLGGASSGKSAYAEGLAAKSGLDKTYVATAQAFDAEMQAKIKAHQEARATANWTTIEAPMWIEPAIEHANGVVLVDCLTLWISNHFLAENPTDDLATKFLNAQNASAAHIIAVSNEVGLGVVPDNKLARDFRTIQGQMNQAIAAQADLVVNVIAGIPTAIKGTSP